MPKILNHSDGREAKVTIQQTANTVVAIDNKVASVDDRVRVVDDRVAEVFLGTQIIFNQSPESYLITELLRWKGSESCHAANRY